MTEQDDKTAAAEPGSLASAMAPITALRRQAEELLAEAMSIRARAVSEAEGILAQAVESAEQILQDGRLCAARTEFEAAGRARDLVDNAQAEAEAAQRRTAAAVERARTAASIADEDLGAIGAVAAKARDSLTDELDSRRGQLLADLEDSWRRQRDLLEQETRDQLATTLAQMQAWCDRYGDEVRTAWWQRLQEVEEIASTLGQAITTSSSTLIDALSGLTQLREQAGLVHPEGAR